MGAGQSSTQRTIENAASIVTESMISAVLKVNQKCVSESIASNMLDVRATGDSQATLKCVEAGNTPEACGNAFRATVDASNINMSASARLSSTCSIDMEMLQSVQNQMITDLTQKASGETDLLGESLKALASTISNLGKNTNDSTTVSNSTAIRNIIQNSVTMEVVQETIAKAIATNALSISATGVSAVRVSGVTLTAAAEVVLNALSKNESVQAAVVAMDNKVAQEAADKKKGVADLVDSFFGGVAGVIGSVGGLLQAAALPALLSACCGCCICVIFIMMRMNKKGGGGN